MIQLRQKLMKAVGRGRSRRNAGFSSIHDVDYRWQLIRPHLPNQPSWVLDIGSNDGDTCRRAAALGHYALGVEVAPTLVSRANETAPSQVAFMAASVSPEMLRAMPDFDVVFLLSVAHRIWAIHGRSYAEECLRLAFEKAKLVIFEGAIRHVRYTDEGAQSPDFVDEDLESARQWHEEWLVQHAPKGWKVSYLGAVHPLNGNAPRIVFVGKP